MTGHRAREHYLLNDGWRFHRGDVHVPALTQKLETYMHSHGQRAQGAFKKLFYDHDWERVDLPHDWVVSSEYDAGANTTHGYRARGVGWYRRAFALDEDLRGRRVYLRFEGVTAEATIFVNDFLAGRVFTSAVTTTLDVTELVTYGNEVNLLSVRIDASGFEGWYYEGAGIYRDVWLVTTPKTRLDAASVFARARQLDGDEWELVCEATVKRGAGLPASGLPAGETLTARLELLDADGTTTASAETAVDPAPLDETDVAWRVPVSGPRLWSPDAPDLYDLRLTLMEGEQAVDRVEQRFGFRTIELDRSRGMLVNGTPTPIRGVNIHQSHGGVGVAMPRALMVERIRTLKACGVNAYRSAHHPIAPAMLEVCDELGMLVMTENRWFDTSDETLAHVRNMVLEARNHPSVFIYSIANEEPLQSSWRGTRIARRLYEEARRADDTRPVTAALNGGLAAGEMIEVFDVVSVNYRYDEYDEVIAAYPDRVFVASESGAHFTVRDDYPVDADERSVRLWREHQFNFSRPWPFAQRQVDSREAFAGIFYWAGIDYAGEATWPEVVAALGAIDYAGFPKDYFFFLKALWTDEPVLHLFPHWNWDGYDGYHVPVTVYTNYDRVELFLNGVSLGAKENDPYSPPRWDVAYEPGVLTAVGTGAGKGEKSVERRTVGPARELHIGAETATVDRNRIVSVVITALDENGERAVSASPEVTVTANGAARIVGLSSGDPTDHVPDNAATRPMFGGLLKAFIRVDPEATRFTLRAAGAAAAGAAATGADAAALRAETTIELRPASRPTKRLPAAEQRLQIQSWFRSGVSGERTTSLMHAEEDDFNTYLPVTVSEPEYFSFSEPGYCELRCVTEPILYDVERSTAYIVFRSVAGSAEFYRSVAYLGGESTPFERVAEKPAADPAEVRIEYRHHPDVRYVAIYAIVRNPGGMSAGFLGPVEWEVR